MSEQPNTPEAPEAAPQGEQTVQAPEQKPGEGQRSDGPGDLKVALKQSREKEKALKQQIADMQSQLANQQPGQTQVSTQDQGATIPPLSIEDMVDPQKLADWLERRDAVRDANRTQPLQALQAELQAIKESGTRNAEQQVKEKFDMFSSDAQIADTGYTAKGMADMLYANKKAASPDRALSEICAEVNREVSALMVRGATTQGQPISSFADVVTAKPAQTEQAANPVPGPGPGMGPEANLKPQMSGATSINEARARNKLFFDTASKRGFAPKSKQG